MQQPAPPPKLNLRRLESIQRVLRYAAVAVLSVFVALIAYGAYQLRRINIGIDEKQARLAGLDAELRKKEGEITERDKTIERLDTTVETLIDPKRSLSPEQAAEVEKTIDEKLAEISETGQIPPRVYIQIGCEEKRKIAGDVARQLQTRGFLTLGIQNTHAPGPSDSVLRYYQTNEVTQTDIRNLLEFLQGIGVRSVLKVIGVTSYTGHRRHYEIWLGDDFGRCPPAVETRPTPVTEPTREPTPRPTR
jgi:hypothetical protein